MSTEVANAVRVCASSELVAGAMRPASLGALPVVVIRLADGSLRAFVNRCLHQGAPLTAGRLSPRSTATELGEYRLDESSPVLRCPWHGYEYDVRTGCTLFHPARRLRALAVTERDGWILLTP